MNHWANFNQTWHKASLGDGDSSFCSNKGSRPFPRGDNGENILTNFKDHLFKNQTQYKAPLDEGDLNLNE